MVLDDDSGEITRLTLVGNLSQNDGYIHTVKTPWEVQRKAIRSGDKGKTHFDSPSLDNYIKQPKSFFVEIFPNPMDEKEKGHEICHTSPSVTIKVSAYCCGYDILGKYVMEVPIPSNITESMTSSTKFQDEVHPSIHRF